MMYRHSSWHRSSAQQYLGLGACCLIDQCLGLSCRDAMGLVLGLEAVECVGVCACYITTAPDIGDSGPDRGNRGGGDPGGGGGLKVMGARWK